MLVPQPRGTLSQALFSALREGGREIGAPDSVQDDGEEDRQIALWSLYELHYRGFEDVADDREWDPALVALRVHLERTFEAELRERFEPPEIRGDLGTALFRYVADFDGPSVAEFVHRKATQDEVLALLRWKSIYHLKETDPASFVVPRLEGAAQTGLVELMYDEYGGGDPARHHARLFAAGLEACGLSSVYGDYIDEAPVEILAENNAMSLFGLNRRLRGAAMGHLAAFEATSSMPSRRMAQGIERLGLPEEMAAYYREHVEADAVHEQVAARMICGAMAEADPAIREDIFFGAFTCLDLSDRFARTVIDQWEEAA